MKYLNFKTGLNVAGHSIFGTIPEVNGKGLVALQSEVDSIRAAFEELIGMIGSMWGVGSFFNHASTSSVGKRVVVKFDTEGNVISITKDGYVDNVQTEMTGIQAGIQRATWNPDTQSWDVAPANWQNGKVQTENTFDTKGIAPWCDIEQVEVPVTFKGTGSDGSDVTFYQKMQVIPKFYWFVGEATITFDKYDSSGTLTETVQETGYFIFISKIEWKPFTLGETTITPSLPVDFYDEKKGVEVPYFLKAARRCQVYDVTTGNRNTEYNNSSNEYAVLVSNDIDFDSSLEYFNSYPNRYNGQIQGLKNNEGTSEFRGHDLDWSGETSTGRAMTVWLKVVEFNTLDILSVAAGRIGDYDSFRLEDGQDRPDRGQVFNFMYGEYIRIGLTSPIDEASNGKSYMLSGSMSMTDKYGIVDDLGLNAFTWRGSEDSDYGNCSLWIMGAENVNSIIEQVTATPTVGGTTMTLTPTENIKVGEIVYIDIKGYIDTNGEPQNGTYLTTLTETFEGSGIYNTWVETRGTFTESTIITVYKMKSNYWYVCKDRSKIVNYNESSQVNVQDFLTNHVKEGEYEEIGPAPSSSDPITDIYISGDHTFAKSAEIGFGRKYGSDFGFSGHNINCINSSISVGGSRLSSYVGLFYLDIKWDIQDSTFDIGSSLTAKLYSK